MARRPGLLIREKRLQGLSAYLGAAGPLLEEFARGDAAQRVRTFSQVAPDDVTAALAFLGSIEGAAIVVHAPRGCANALAASAAAAWAVTGLNQRDTIIGSGSVLDKTVRAIVARHRPWVVFVVGGPVVAINSDDSVSATAELTEELGIPVQVVRTDGFRSRIAATGFDAAVQAVLPLIEPNWQPKLPDLVNLIALSRPLADAVAELLTPLGLSANTLPAGANANAFATAARARASIVLDGDAGEVLAQVLETEHGVPSLRVPLPIGFESTAAFLTALAEATGRDLPASAEPAPVANTLAGARVHLAFPPTLAFAATKLVEELGGSISGITVDHFDTTHVEAATAFAARHPDAPLHIAAGQPFELVNSLAKSAPDLFVGAPALAALASASGVPSIGAEAHRLIGDRGAAWLARAARKARSNPAFARRLAKRAPAYASGWLRRSADWHIKQEVR